MPLPVIAAMVLLSLPALALSSSCRPGLALHSFKSLFQSLTIHARTLGDALLAAGLQQPDWRGSFLVIEVIKGNLALEHFVIEPA